MKDIPYEAAPAPRKLWVRALLMILFSAAFQLAAWILLCIAVVQLLLAAVSDGPNLRLQSFGGSLGRYLGQICEFECFRSEVLPFPFTEWPLPADGSTA
jgi:hypothetical protein